MSRTRVWIVDDHAVVRRGLRSFLSLQDDVDVTGEAATGDEALALLNATRSQPDLPDVILLDLVMPGRDGVATTQELTSRYPSIAVVILTSFMEVDRVRAALRVGALGYISKTAGPDDVVAAISAAHNGQVHLDPSVTRQLAQLVNRPADDQAGLTSREREVLALIAKGNSNRDISGELGISERTARTHVSNLLSKLGLTSRTQAALWAVRRPSG